MRIVIILLGAVSNETKTTRVHSRKISLWWCEYDTFKSLLLTDHPLAMRRCSDIKKWTSTTLILCPESIIKMKDIVESNEKTIQWVQAHVHEETTQRKGRQLWHSGSISRGGELLRHSWRKSRSCSYTDWTGHTSGTWAPSCGHFQNFGVCPQH